MSEVPKLQRFNEKTGHPKWPICFYIASKKWVFQSHRRVHSTTGDVHAFFNAKRVFACILFCSWPCFSFSFDACAFVGTMIALNLAIVIQNLPRTQKMFNLLGFTHVFDMGISLFLWYLLWHCLCTPKFYPKYFYPGYSKFFSVHTRRVEIGHILCSRSWLYICVYIPIPSLL